MRAGWPGSSVISVRKIWWKQIFLGHSAGFALCMLCGRTSLDLYAAVYRKGLCSMYPAGLQLAQPHFMISKPFAQAAEQYQCPA